MIRRYETACNVNRLSADYARAVTAIAAARPAARATSDRTFCQLMVDVVARASYLH
jgi:hypothetical protein